LDVNTRITTSPVAEALVGVFNGPGFGWIEAGFAGFSYGVADFRYETTGLLTLMCVDAQGALLRLDGQAGERYVVEASEDAINWRPIGVHTLSGPSLEVRIGDASEYPIRFYRAVYQAEP
jgi:hypothetical protein